MFVNQQISIALRKIRRSEVCRDSSPTMPAGDS